jgi:hypothetical protein
MRQATLKASWLVYIAVQSRGRGVVAVVAYQLINAARAPGAASAWHSLGGTDLPELVIALGEVMLI